MGIRVLWEDENLWAVVKPAGAISEDGNGLTVPGLIREATGAEYVGVVHRLDREAAGVMVYAKTPASARYLSEQVSARRMEKDYLALVHGSPEEEYGEYRDLLFRDAKRGKSFPVTRMRKGVKEAVLRFHRIQSDGELSLVRVRLETGRTHQIRVQFSSRQMPLWADRRYGGKETGNLALWSCRIAFLTAAGERRTFFARPEGEPWGRFAESLARLPEEDPGFSQK